MRAVTRRYEDPLDRIWIETAARIGLSVTRTPDAFATTDGRGALALGDAASLDADDCLAQMIFHELCHSLVQGVESFEQPDWGLENTDPRDLSREHACLRAQATLAARVGLRRVLAPTTDHRAFFDALGPDPLFDAGAPREDPSVALARIALARAERPPWAPHLRAALEASAAVVRAAAAFAPEGSLLADVDRARALHPAGGWVHPSADVRCGACAWRDAADCVVAAAPVEEAWPGCEAFTGALDCRACGACCREGFDVVELAPDEPFLARHGALVDRVDGRLVLRRPGGRCPPLRGDGHAEPYACAAYAERPRACRELAPGSEGCLAARRRIGLSL
ncbi:MAG: YkgJ family cysteine cluster protein [Sandaracinaceae bacterium]|nr:YkgJ family cysteine cluster protein [Sandaracinaceae bacterium]